MLNSKQRRVLEFLHDNQTTQECYKPIELSNIFSEIARNEEITADVCIELYNKKLITAVSYSSGNRKLNTCYKISDKGIDELNPNSRDKNIYKLIVIGTISAVVAAIAAIISIFT